MGVRQKGQVWMCVLGLLMAVAFVAWVAGPAQAQRQKITGKDGAPMVLVPAGEFSMGSNDGSDDEKPVHRVSLDAYYLDKYEVTVGQYAKFLEAAGMNGPPMWTTMDEPPPSEAPGRECRLVGCEQLLRVGRQAAPDGSGMGEGGTGDGWAYLSLGQ
jgi:formylglycine-generating enzyme required for sulfatase activity